MLYTSLQFFMHKQHTKLMTKDRNLKVKVDDACDFVRVFLVLVHICNKFKVLGPLASSSQAHPPIQAECSNFFTRHPL